MYRYDYGLFVELFAMRSAEVVHVSLKHLRVGETADNYVLWGSNKMTCGRVKSLLLKHRRCSAIWWQLALIETR